MRRIRRIFEFLAAHDVALTWFHGYDVSQLMLDEAQNRISAPNLKLVPGSEIDRQADFSFTSSIFNVLFSSNGED